MTRYPTCGLRPRIRNEKTGFGNNQFMPSSGSSLDARVPGESGTVNSTPGSLSCGEVIEKFGGQEDCCVADNGESWE